jgi:hypothetical protein
MDGEGRWQQQKEEDNQHGEPPKRVGRGLLISRARATRGRGLPSPGLMARFGVPVGGWVRKSRAVGD